MKKPFFELPAISFKKLKKMSDLTVILSMEPFTLNSQENLSLSNTGCQGAGLVGRPCSFLSPWSPSLLPPLLPPLTPILLPRHCFQGHFGHCLIIKARDILCHFSYLFLDTNTSSYLLLSLTTLPDLVVYVTKFQKKEWQELLKIAHDNRPTVGLCSWISHE